MKKADWMHYASELECKLVKAEAEIERIRAEREDKVRAEIREEERKGWVETGLIMARDEVEAVLEDRELPFDLYYSLKYAMRDAVDSIDVASIVE
jgi:hypothetical protein